jgi:hypothetical protein
VKLIIYLASYDPSARTNHNTLVEERQWTLGNSNVKLQVIEINNEHIIKIANPSVPNVFEDPSLSANQELRVELVAHGDGSRWIKCMPYDQWDDRPGASNTYKDINAGELRDFFRTHASEEGRYKFNELTLFCCSGYKFGKELALLMPEIKITCFKEYIKILGADGMAYPYTAVKEGNNTLIKPIDKNGVIITTPEQKHYSAAQWVLEGNKEKIIYACADAIPGQIAVSSNTPDPRPVVVRGNVYHLPQVELGSLQEKKDASTNSTLGTLNTQQHSDSNSNSGSEITESENHSQPRISRMR